LDLISYVLKFQKKIKELSRRRVGLIIDGPPAREGVIIADQNGNDIGIITSGTVSPVLKKSISMGYVKPPLHNVDSKVVVKIRGKSYPSVVVKLPFVPTNYKHVE